MSDEFLSTIRKEIEALEASLSKDPTYRRLNALKTVLREYELPESQHRSSTSVGASQGQHTRRTAPARKASPEREQAINFARKFLENATSPTPTREIFEAMVDEGISIGGKSPQNNLSAILSNNDEFKSYGRSGWVLVENDPLVGLEIDLDSPATSGADADGSYERPSGSDWEKSRDPKSAGTGGIFD